MPVASGSRFVDTIWHDLRYAVRTLSRSWGFTALGRVARDWPRREHRELRRHALSITWSPTC